MLCSHFLLSYGNQAMTCMGNMGGFFSCENTPEGRTETHKRSYKEVRGRNGDHEWLRMTNAFILCDLLWKFQKGHAANRERSFNKSSSTDIYEQTCIVCLNLCQVDA